MPEPALHASEGGATLEAGFMPRHRALIGELARERQITEAQGITIAELQAKIAGLEEINKALRDRIVELEQRP